MNPGRVDFLTDLAYGLAIAVAIGLILLVGTDVGIAFGLGVLASYVIHIGWKMARFDPEWMTGEVAQRIEETVGEEIETSVEESVEEAVEGTVGEEIERNVEETVGEQVDDVIEKVERLEGQQE